MCQTAFGIDAESGLLSRKHYNNNLDENLFPALIHESDTTKKKYLMQQAQNWHLLLLRHRLDKIFPTSTKTLIKAGPRACHKKMFRALAQPLRQTFDLFLWDRMYHVRRTRPIIRGGGEPILILPRHEVFVRCLHNHCNVRSRCS